MIYKCTYNTQIWTLYSTLRRGQQKDQLQQMWIVRKKPRKQRCFQMQRLWEKNSAKWENDNKECFAVSAQPIAVINCSGSYTVKNLEAGALFWLWDLSFETLRPWCFLLFLNVFDAQALIAKCRKRMAEINELKACRSFCISCVWNRLKSFTTC